VIVLIAILCILFGFGIYVLLVQTGVVPGERQRERERLYAPRAPHLRELPQGCLISLIVVATVWFGAWAVVLVLALNFLRAPFKG
jgi:hypothetical protein